MRRFVALSISVFLATGVAARDAAPDSTYLLGGPDRWDGRFETSDGEASWHGWTFDHLIDPYPDAGYWHISDFNVPAGGGQYAMWCGKWFPTGMAEGYGNYWDESLLFSYTVPDPSQTTRAFVTGDMNVDTEHLVDLVYFEVNRGGSWEILRELHGSHVGYRLNVSCEFQPGDYVEDGQAQMRIRFASDRAYSDEDFIDTQGAVQVDNLEVSIEDGPSFFDDFEDQVSHYWVPTGGSLPPSYASLAQDLHPQNMSWQVNWLDYEQQFADFMSIGWIASPALELPAELAQLVFAFDVTTNFSSWHQQSVYTWYVRSTADADPKSLQAAVWRNHDLGYLGSVSGAVYRDHFELADLLVPDAQFAQFSFRVFRRGGYQVSPEENLPFFDNAAVVAVHPTASSVPAPGGLAVTAYPNPFNPRTTFTLTLPQAAEVSVQVYDARGRLVRGLHRGPLDSGRHDITWDGNDDGGRAVAAGVYLYDVRAAADRRTGRVVLVR